MQPLPTRAPDAATIEAIAREAMMTLPEAFRVHLADIVLRVDDFADDDVLTEMEIDNAYELTGLYTGHPIGMKTMVESGAMPDMIHLYRIPILLEWVESGEDLKHLVRHVLIHEVGHHFGLSDDDMHAIEDSAR